MTVPRRILAATDFSQKAERAKRAALQLARAFDAELHIVHAQVLLDDPHLQQDERAEVERLIASTEQTKRDAIGTVEGEEDAELAAYLVRGLDAAEVIAETCRDLECDFIVMGTKGRRGLGLMLLGSVAEKVIRSVAVPVLTVRQDAELPDGGRVRKILVPYDFSERSASAVRYAGSWAERLGAQITLLHVVEPVVYPEFYSVDLLPDDTMQRVTDRAQEELEAASATLLEGIDTTAEIRIGRAAETIVARAKPGDFDLVIMGKQGLSALEHLIMGSVAESVLRRCKIPMVAVPY
jgi:nucleotide-binding universal stress UspA family protein